jgi:hypothetical protein
MAMLLVIQALGKGAVGKWGDVRRICHHAPGGGVDTSRVASLFAWVGDIKGGRAGLPLSSERRSGDDMEMVFNLVHEIWQASPAGNGEVGA